MRYRAKKLSELWWSFFKVGLFTFGGGYAMIAIISSTCVDQKHWLTQEEMMDLTVMAESTPGPIAINSATYIGYHLAGFSGAAMATLAVCIPSFLIIYCISLFFERFLNFTYVACAFKGIQVCVIYLILSTGINMLKALEKNVLNTCILCAVMAAMLICSITAVSFSSVFYILFFGATGVFIYFLQKIRKENIHK